jgi:N-formylmaleamate deformylase
MSWASGAVTVDGVALHYTRTGGTGLPVLVLLHGITDDGLCWGRVAADLEGEFDVLMPDARGHGRSAGPDGDLSVPRLAADVAGLLDTLGIARAFVFGHSMGAITAAAVAATRPDLVRGVIVEDPPLERGAPPPPGLIEKLVADAALWPTLTPDERHAKAAAENAAWDRSETDPWADSKATVRPEVLAHLAAVGSFDWEPVFARMRCPGLLVTGDRELFAIVGPAAAARAIELWPAGRVVHVGGAGHCIHRDRWEETMTPVRAFLREQAARP